MKPAEAISSSIIERATLRLAGCAGFAARLRWWLQRGHACEAWVRFEWAYRIEQEVRPDFAVVCECDNRRDIVLVGAKDLPFARATTQACIELKWWGNWYFSKRDVDDLNADINKVDQYSCPAAAIMLFLEVDATQLDPELNWIAEQINAGGGATNFDALQQDPRFSMSLRRGPNHRCSVKVSTGSPFASAVLHVLAWYNSPAGGPSLSGLPPPRP